ncbi:MAG TPA: PQQ-dependent sugar dehydrogenase [Mycobacteriales bacterium]|nr:PQQ-dependent sugar dehydrogenase [Mycobacteriales bacterium]
MPLTRHPSRSRRAAAAVVLLPLLLGACGDDPVPSAGPDADPTTTRPSPATSPSTPTTPPSPPPAQGTPDPSAVQVLVTGLQAPWGIGFLPGGDALVTERDTARVLRVPAGGGTPTEVTRVREAAPGGEGGLLGLAVSPRFETDRLVYVYVTTAADNRVVRFRLDDPARTEAVVTGIPKARVHNGGRIAFGPDGNLYVGTGDAGDTALSQDEGSLGGKVLRTTPDGEPVSGGSLVFSKGHRNVQGLAFDDDGRVYAVEFGQNRFDEVNVVEQGTNGGWPAVEGPGDGGGRFLAPITTWTTDEASPSGAALTAGSLWVAALRGERLWRVPLDGRGGAGEPEPLLRGEFGRLRTAATAPDGSLWVLTSNRDGRGDPTRDDDRVLRLPAR